MTTVPPERSNGSRTAAEASELPTDAAQLREDIQDTRERLGTGEAHRPVHQSVTAVREKASEVGARAAELTARAQAKIPDSVTGQVSTATVAVRKRPVYGAVAAAVAGVLVLLMIRRGR
jgi:uncharacterized protein YoxC